MTRDWLGLDWMLLLVLMMVGEPLSETKGEDNCLVFAEQASMVTSSSYVNKYPGSLHHSR